MEKITGLQELNNLIDTKQYTRLRQELSEYNDADIALFLEALADEEMLKIFRILPKGLAADVFSYLPMDSQQMIIISLSDREASGIINNLMADDATDLLEEMPANIVKKLLANANPEVRHDINHLLRYPEDSAGSIMTVEYLDLKENLTVEEAIWRIRKVGVDSETIDICYVVDNKRTLIGMVALRYILFSEADTTIGELMDDHVIALHTLMDQEEVAHQFQKYDLTAMPVVDNEKRLVGIVTVDDVVDIMQEEATEDMEKMAAILPSDKPYMKTTVWETFKKRIPWLLLLMISATFTGKIIASYESALQACTVLTAFIPMLMDSAGNAGGQASVTIIRGLSLNEIRYKDWFRIVWKESRVAIMCGLALAIANLIKLLLFDGVTMEVAFVICSTLFCTIVIAKIVGCTLPMCAKKVGFDPAVMASPFITTIVDALSLSLYFTIATHALGL
ncbi:MAG: magnesium transporter [Eubacteriales bacterium]